MDLLQRLQDEFKDALPVQAAAPADAVDGVTPQAVAAPADEATAQALVGWCGREKVSFIPRGGSTKLEVGARPQACDLIISTGNLNTIIEHDEGNATVAAQAGITLATLNQMVGQQRQFVPLEETGPQGKATLGGIIATNHAGMTRLKYGTPRDLVVGLHAVLSDGRLVKAGSKVVKNVSGYDLNKVFIGSFGNLGLITEITIRLRPNNAASALWQGEFKTWQEAIEQARAIFEGPFEPTALRIHADGSAFFVLAQFDGVEKAVQIQMERLPATISKSDVGNQAGANGAGELRLRAVLPLQSAGIWAQQVQQSGATKIAWDYGLGIIYATYSKVPDNAVEVVTKLRAQAQSASGLVVVERAPDDLKTPDFVWGATPSAFALMQSLKNTFDAANVCAPGRFVGGL